MPQKDSNSASLSLNTIFEDPELAFKSGYDPESTLSSQKHHRHLGSGGGEVMVCDSTIISASNTNVSVTIGTTS